MMQLSDPWMIVFCDGHQSPPGSLLSFQDRLVEWVLRCCRPGFSHVYAFRPMAGGWLVVEPLSTGIDVWQAPYDWIHAVQRAVDSKTIRVVMAMCSRGNGGPPDFCGIRLVSCVWTVQALLGRDLGAITPFQLYEKLMEEQMGGLMGGGEKPDTSAQDAQLAKMKEEQARLERENAAKMRTRRGRGGVGGALMRFDPESGSGTAEV